LSSVEHEIQLTGEEPNKLLISNTNPNTKEYQINIGDLINQKINKYRNQDE